MTQNHGHGHKPQHTPKITVFNDSNFDSVIFTHPE